jgi:hypothetical protein
MKGNMEEMMGKFEEIAREEPEIWELRPPVRKRGREN